MKESANKTLPNINKPPWRCRKSKIFIVLPAYNEEGNLASLLSRIDQAMYEDDLMYKVIIVDDGSTDETCSIAKKFAEHMPIHIDIHQVNQGLAAAIRSGLSIASEITEDDDIVVTMDADNSHTPGLIRSMIRYIKEGNDVVIASRYQNGSFIRGVSFFRQVLSIGASILIKFLFPINGVRDYTCGYRAYKGKILKDAIKEYGDSFISEQGFQCMVDILLKLRTMDIIIREVPLILRYDLKVSESKMDIGTTIVKTLALLIKRRIRLN